MTGPVTSWLSSRGYHDRQGYRTGNRAHGTITGCRNIYARIVTSFFQKGPQDAGLAERKRYEAGRPRYVPRVAA